jgi:hypothetical protein
MRRLLPLRRLFGILLSFFGGRFLALRPRG